MPNLANMPINSNYINMNLYNYSMYAILVTVNCNFSPILTSLEIGIDCSNTETS